MEEQKLMPFEGKAIRKTWHNGEWYFSVVDVIEILTGTDRPRKYWNDLKKKLVLEGYNQLSEKIGQLKMTASDGKERLTDGSNLDGIFRILMSIPSPKAEPLKLWLAKVGKERIEEIENPEIGFDRLRDLYQAKGYSEEWINARLKSIDIRKQLTDEWKNRGVLEGLEYAILTAEIARGTFGVTPSEHKQIKNLDKQNLRDHMTNLELIFTMLGEETTRQISIRDDAQGFLDNQYAAQKGGNMAGNARENYEKQNVPVVSSDNFLKQIEAATTQDIPTDETKESLTN